MIEPACRFEREVDDFLEWERTQEERWEFLDGQAGMMVGATVDHNRIRMNLVLSPAPRLPAGCTTFTEAPLARAESFTRQDGGWHYDVVEGLESALPLALFGLGLPLTEIYRGVVLR